MLRRFSLTSVSVIALAGAVNAADIYVPGPAGPGGYKDEPYFAPWSGFYAGVNGGYGRSANTEDVVFFTSSGFTLPGKGLNAE
jgi:outer membrane immunogenic protein